MKFDYRVSILVMICVGLVVFGILNLPPLTNGGSRVPPGVSQETFDAAVQGELAYCRQKPEAIDCACFAQKSGIILTTQTPRIPQAVYADKRPLARQQAAESC